VEQTLSSILLSVLFALLGFVLLFIGYRVFDGLIPSNLNKQIFEEGNLAAAIVVGAFIIGMALIVANAIN
jgi:putative membrane protein